MTVKEMQESIEPLVDEAHKREETALREYGRLRKSDAARNEAADWQKIENLLCNLSAELSRKAGI
jgi:hypothetical protein